MITVGLKLVRADGSSLRAQDRVVYPVGEWIEVPGNGAYVAVSHQADLRCGGDGPLLIAVQCQEPTGVDAPPGIACFRRVRRMSEGCASAGPLRAYDAARAEPLHAYDAARAEALRAYYVDRNKAWRVYRAACDAARDKAWCAYYDACDEAQRAYYAACAEPQRAFDAARAEAWLALVAAQQVGGALNA